MTENTTIFGSFFCKDPAPLLADYPAEGLYAQLLGRFRPALPYTPQVEMQEWLAGFAWAAELQSRPETALRFEERSAREALSALLSPRSSGFSRGVWAFVAAYTPGYPKETPTQEPETANVQTYELPCDEANRSAATGVNANVAKAARVEVFRRDSLIFLQSLTAEGECVTFSLEADAAQALAGMLTEAARQARSVAESIAL